MTAELMTEWECFKCEGVFLDPLANIPNDKVCSICSGDRKKFTSAGVKPAESLDDVLARDSIKVMSSAEKMEYLKIVGFSIHDIETRLQHK